jgi:methylated-DNA-[protein]-cysteine S-methyltransferase
MAMRSHDTALRWSRTPSPIGPLLLVGHDGALTGLFVADHERCPPGGVGWLEDDAALADARRQVGEYFEGTRTRFDLAIEPSGTAFQMTVWRALLDIPYGETISYGELARRTGRPSAARAVGAASGRNPISVVVPCHRVVGADGTLTGYGWGTDRKRWLLEHEAGVLRLRPGPDVAAL